jgi:hypothetical protein
MDCRHRARKRKRIAEISVPEWAMPTQKTKVVMYAPQPTGVFSPERPIPLMIWFPQEKARSPIPATDRPKRIHHHFPGRESIARMSVLTSVRPDVRVGRRSPVDFFGYRRH